MREILKGISNQPQVQCDTTTQARALIVLARKFGLQNIADKLDDIFGASATENFSYPFNLDKAIDSKLIELIPQQDNNSDDLDSQKRFATNIAVKFGLYDAADFIRWVMK